MNWLNIKSISAIVAAAIAAGTGTHLVQQREADRLQSENQSLIAQQNQLTSERDAAISALAQKNDDVAQSLKEKDELLKLRGEVGLLRRQASDLARLTVEDRQLRSQSLLVKGTAYIEEPRAQSPDAERNACINNLRQIDGAMQLCGLENRLTSNDLVTAEQILPYFRNNELPRCPSGGTYAFAYLTNTPTCSISGHTLTSSAPPTVVITQSADGKDTVLPGRHMSESQVADIAFRELPRGSSFRCEFKNGVWDILEVQKDVWGASSVTTNADGRVSVTSTNATQVILKVQDADGKVMQVKTP